MYKATQTRIQTYLNDVAGVRIVCAFIDDNRLDEQIRQAVLSLETKWTEKDHRAKSISQSSQWWYVRRRAGHGLLSNDSAKQPE